MTWSFRNEYVRCGKKTCKTCPHGPYWYRYEKRNGKLHKEYIGKESPEQLAGDQGREDGKPHKHDRILNPQTASYWLALEILGLPASVGYEEAKAKARKLLRNAHPDRGGDNKLYCRLNAAWAYMRQVNQWK